MTMPEIYKPFIVVHVI